MIETFPVVVSEAFLHASSLTLILGTLYAVIWFGFGFLWAVRQVRRGRLIVPVTVHTVQPHQPTK